jgi:hypothetical protein
VLMAATFAFEMAALLGSLIRPVKEAFVDWL